MRIPSNVSAKCFRLAHAAAKKVHVAGENYSATFGMALRAELAGFKSRLARIADVGREGEINTDLEYRNWVRGGGAITPGVVVFSDYDACSNLRLLRDGRSRSQASGARVWQLQADRLYRLSGVNVSSSRSATYWLSTFDGKTTVFGSEQRFEVERRKRFPSGYELAKIQGEQRRVAEEARRQRQIIIERERLEKMQIEAERRERVAAERKAQQEAEVERLESEGQPKREGLPLLRGSTKQIAWALRIRDAVAAKEPKNPALKRGLTASYWIENYRSVLPRI